MTTKVWIRRSHTLSSAAAELDRALDAYNEAAEACELIASHPFRRFELTEERPDA